jgi:hypothetical protein
MNRKTRLLLPFILPGLFLFAGNTLASRTNKVTLTAVQDCATSCAQKRDVTLQRCDRLAGDRKTTCQNSVNSQYDKCVQNCADGGSSSGGSGKP